MSSYLATVDPRKSLDCLFDHFEGKSFSFVDPETKDTLKIRCKRVGYDADMLTQQIEAVYLTFISHLDSPVSEALIRRAIADFDAGEVVSLLKVLKD